MSASLERIRKKIRRLVKAPSQSQLSNQEINEHVNDIVKFGMPQECKVFTLTRTLTFYTRPYVDVYSTVTSNQGDPLYDFKNKYYEVSKPVYISGDEVFYSQSVEQFYNVHPKSNYVVKIGSGDGIQTVFQGSIGAEKAPIYRNNVLFSSVDNNGNAIQRKDVPVTDRVGNIVSTDDQSDQSSVSANNNINYVTGDYIVTFNSPPDNGADVYIHTVPYKASKPRSMLFFNNEFTIRPVPDKSYPVNIQVYVQPVELMGDTDKPELDLWWQFIAYKAAQTILVEMSDNEKAEKMELYAQEQASNIIRRTINIMSNERSATLYMDNIGTSGPNKSFYNNNP